MLDIIINYQTSKLKKQVTLVSYVKGMNTSTCSILFLTNSLLPPKCLYMYCNKYKYKSVAAIYSVNCMVHIYIQAQSDSTDSRKQRSSCSSEGVIAESERGTGFAFVS